MAKPILYCVHTSYAATVPSDSELRHAIENHASRIPYQIGHGERIHHDQGHPEALNPRSVGYSPPFFQWPT